MTNGSTELTPPEFTVDDVLRIPDDRFTPDTVAVVTGGGSGIGQATSVALALNGLTVAAVDIDEEGLEETVDVATALDAEGRVVPLEGDLTDDEAVEAAIDEAADLGTIRYAANIAGMQHIAPIADFPMETYDFMHDLMLRSPFLLSKLVIPHIEATDDGVGAIGNMSSVHGHYATQNKPAYITLKHGLTGLTRAIAAEGGGSLRGFSVSVGYVLTPLMVDQIEDTAEERGISEQAVIEDVMLGQARTTEMMTPAEVANLFVFGFSSHAKHLNGADLLWDGGYTTTYE
ncbi:SDR family oxidoreductase [Natronorubrum thiooxidans]|uniref:3-hydroxybutyrate dehydrogenase n=1 Tax=Natronorubrum thiooxidans TaxID=308853 RepID=A0A1N7GM12_9EURY|nr:SDR family oxidoreductase [Natronorubrum thiooxidans]SIS13546.1 3-hydroxybutyrate dehydrogenase [Natronorubrum thiooxidans]